jgi:hypothetical protein
MIADLENQIIVEVKNNYGKETFYPICSKAVLFARLTGCKTLTIDSLKTIKSLGYEVAVQQKQYSI